jgi:hypothetical protein
VFIESRIIDVSPEIIPERVDIDPILMLLDADASCTIPLFKGLHKPVSEGNHKPAYDVTASFSSIFGKNVMTFTFPF